MHRILICSAIALIVSGCAATKITEAEIEAAESTLDFGDFRSETLTLKAWQAKAAGNYPAVLAYTRECVRRYGEEGKRPRRLSHR